MYIKCPTRTNKSKSLITLDNKKSPEAARFPVRQLEIYYCFYSYLAWYVTIKTTERNKTDGRVAYQATRFYTMLSSPAQVIIIQDNTTLGLQRYQ